MPPHLTPRSDTTRELTMAFTRSRGPRASAAHAAAPAPAPAPASAPPTDPVCVPIRFQCPLCFDVLRLPIQLPCCKRHLCKECFERALELTSVNCGFCRRRVVGFARTKQYKLDEALWKDIQLECPFLGDGTESGMEDVSPPIDFFDEDAPPLHGIGEDHPTSQQNASQPGEIKAFYEKQLRAHEAERQAAEARALEQTMEFLETDPELTAAVTTASSSSSSSSPDVISSTTTRHRGVTRRPDAHNTRSRDPSTHRPVTRSKSNADGSKQQRLDHFFGSSRPSSTRAGSASTSANNNHNTSRMRRAHTATIGLMSPSTRSRTKLGEPNVKRFPRSASHSPPVLRRQTSNARSRKALFQLTIDSTNSPVALHTRGREQQLASKMATRQSRRRRAWRCLECTYENTCFDSRCCMCRSAAPPEAYNSLSSQ